MDRKEVLLGLAMADVATGHFAMGDAGCGAVYEGLALGRPLIHYRDERQAGGLLAYPFLPARSAEDVERALAHAIDQPGAMRDLGHRAASWYDEQFVTSSVDGLTSLIRAAESGDLAAAVERLRAKD
jgi:hypothetical protein